MSTHKVTDLVGTPIHVGDIVAVATLNYNRAILRKAEVVSVEVRHPHPDGLQRVKFDGRQMVADGEPDVSWKGYAQATVKVKTWAGETRRSVTHQGDNSAAPVRVGDIWQRRFTENVVVEGILVLQGAKR